MKQKEDFAAQVLGREFELWGLLKIVNSRPRFRRKCPIPAGLSPFWKGSMSRSGSQSSCFGRISHASHSPTRPPRPPLSVVFHRSIWRDDDEAEAAHNPWRDAKLGQQCFLPASKKKLSSTLREGTETLSAIQRVGGKSGYATSETVPKPEQPHIASLTFSFVMFFIGSHDYLLCAGVYNERN